MGQYYINHGVQRPCASTVTAVPVWLCDLSQGEKETQ